MKNKEYSRFSIVFTDQLHRDSYIAELKEVFSEFWKRRVLNVIVIFWMETLHCFTYSPFEERFLVPLNVSGMDSKQLFYEKAKNLNGHQLRIGMFYEPQRSKIIRIGGQTVLEGVDGKVAKMVVQSLNATFKIIEPLDDANLGELFLNGSSNGVFSQFQNETIDMSFNARFFRMKHFRGVIEPSISIGRDDLCILVPRTGISLNLDNIFDAFELPVWIFIIISLPIYAIFFYRYDKKKRIYRNPQCFIHIFLRLFGWNLNQVRRM